MAHGRISWRGFPACLAAATAFLLWTAGPARAQWENVRVLDEGPGGVTFTAAYGDLRFEPRAFDDISVDVPAMDGATTRLAPGKPVVLGQGLMFAVPPDAEIRVKVLDARGLLVRADPWPAAPIPVSDPDDALARPTFRAAPPPAAASPGLFPADVVQVDEIGYLRDQRVARLTIHPLQADLSIHRAMAYQSVTVRVDFARAAAGAPARAARPDPWFEGKADGLFLNKRTARSLGRAIDPSIRPSVKLGAPAGKGPAVKVYVKTRGLYRLTPTDFSGLGITPSTIDPRTFRVTLNGQEIAAYVTGEADGSFDSGDALIFYGEPVTDSIYTNKNVYWITWGAGTGLRMATRSATPSGSATVPPYFPWSETTETNSLWWSATPDWTLHDTWFWARLTAPATVNYTAQVPNPASGSLSATVHTSYEGNTDTTTNPDHHTIVKLGATTIGDQHWDGMIPFQIDSAISQSLLTNGANTITINLPNDTGSTVDKQYFNKIVIDYFRLYQAVGGALRFAAPQAQTYEFHVAGFPDSSILAFDATDPLHVVRLTGGTITGSSTYAIALESAASASTWFEAASNAGYKTPAAIKLDAASSLATPGNSADYLIVTHADLATAAQRLADRRAGQGLRTKIVKIEDIYDEFAYGREEPGAIQSFLQYAYANWQAPAPLYVLLLGDATVDYMNYLGTQPKNLVPTWLTTTYSLGATPCDNRYFLAGSDDLPDFFFGRVPAEDATYVSQFIDKVVAYEDAPLAAWHSRASFVADNDDTVFESMSETLIGETPADVTDDRIYVRVLGGSAAKTAVAAAINGGRLTMNYFGHGSVESWAGELILQSSDVASLTNGTLMPFVSSFNCLNGYFPVTENSRYCLSEAFLKYAGKGSCATFGPTGYGYPSEHYLLSQRLWNALFADAYLEFGAATTQARIESYATFGTSYEIVDTYVFFGDPIMQLKRAATQSYMGLTVPVEAGYNLLGRALDHSLDAQASEIVADINAQGGAALELAAWDYGAGSWRTYDPSFPIDDFAVDATDGFLVHAAASSSWRVLGQSVLPGAKAIPATAGYTLVAVPSGAYARASNLVAAMNGAGCHVAQASRWNADSQTWETYDPTFPLVDFDLDRATGYFLRATAACAFPVTP